MDPVHCECGGGRGGGGVEAGLYADPVIEFFMFVNKVGHDQSVSY